MLNRNDIHSVTELVAYLNQQAEIAATLRRIIDAAGEYTPTPNTQRLLHLSITDCEAAVLPFVGQG